MTEIEIARLCHEANRAYCKALGDDSQVPWESAPPNIQQSAVDGVRFILANDDAPPSASHDNWLKFKVQDGWVYGEVKDAEKKEHPCIVPYNNLPVEQRAKDYIFGAVVRTARAIDSDRLGDGVAGQ